MSSTPFHGPSQTSIEDIIRGSRHLKVAPKTSTDVIVEEPVQITSSVQVIRINNLTIGAFSYLVSGRISVDTTIGRYCSIAHNFEFGSVNHPTSWFSTSPIQYNKDKFAWHHSMKNFQRTPVPKATAKSVFGRSIEIGHDVWIGSNVIVSRGVNIGTGSIVAAGAVVTKDVEPYSIVGGVPAKIIRKRFDEETIRRFLASEWWLLHPEVLSGIDFSDVDRALRVVESARSSFAAKWMPEPAKLTYKK